jgi:predicted glycosyltransferase
MAILDFITPADLKPRIDVIKNILNSSIVDQKPLSDQKIRAIVAAILDISDILEENELTQEGVEDEDILKESVSKSNNQLNLF